MNLTKLIITVLVFIILIFSIFYFTFYVLEEDVLLDAGVSFFVSNSGDDLNDGLSPKSPWKTINKVNKELQGGVISKGDNIYFKRGCIWNEGSIVLRSTAGYESNKMVIGAYGNGPKPIIANSNGNHVIYLDSGGCGHWLIENIEVGKSGSIGILFNQGNIYDLTLNNIILNQGNGCVLYHLDTYEVKNCVFDGGGLAIQGSFDYPICNGKIIDCTFSNSRDGLTIHKTGSFDVGPNHLIINCVGYNCSENGFDITSGENIYLINCESYNNKGPGFLIDHNPVNVFLDDCYSHDEGGSCLYISESDNVVVRNSIFCNQGGSGFILYGDRNNPNVGNISFYNNDFIFYYGENIGEIEPYANDLVFKNNIFVSLNESGPKSFIKYTNGANTSNTFSNWSGNIWWQVGGISEDERFWDDNVVGSQMNFSDWLSLTEVSGEEMVDPKFKDPFFGDFSLSVDSPAVDSGNFLSFLVGSCFNSQYISVVDSSYFCDGFGLFEGDFVFVGDDFNLEVVDVDYLNNFVKIDRVISWLDGEPVGLMYSGSSVDIGAIEFN